jgi:RNA recognition motif-containing protein
MLSFSTSSEQLRELFAPAGEVESATVVADRDTGQLPGAGRDVRRTRRR